MRKELKIQVSRGLAIGERSVSLMASSYSRTDTNDKSTPLCSTRLSKNVQAGRKRSRSQEAGVSDGTAEAPDGGAIQSWIQDRHGEGAGHGRDLGLGRCEAAPPLRTSGAITVLIHVQAI